MSTFLTLPPGGASRTAEAIQVLARCTLLALSRETCIDLTVLAVEQIVTYDDVTVYDTHIAAP